MSFTSSNPSLQGGLFFFLSQKSLATIFGEKWGYADPTVDFFATNCLKQSK
jgi:hypothetical protein